MTSRSEPPGDQLYPVKEVVITSLGIAGSTVATVGGETLDLIHTDNALNSNPSYLKLYDDAAAPTHDSDDPNEKFKVPGGAVGTYLMATFGQGGIILDNPYATGISAAASAASGQTDTEPTYGFNCRIGYHDA